VRDADYSLEGLSIPADFFSGTNIQQLEHFPIGGLIALSCAIRTSNRFNPILTTAQSIQFDFFPLAAK